MTEPLLATEATPTTEVQTGEVSDGSLSTDTTQPQQTDPSTETTETPEGAPETYVFTSPKGVPEGVEVDSKIHDAYSEAARDADLPQDKAQGMFDKTMTAIHDRAIEEQSRQSDEWITQAKADPEFGGDKLDENLGIAKKAIDEFASDGLRELLEGPAGLGNHPEVIRFMHKVGKALSEDRFVGSNKGQAVDPTDEAVLASKLYPSHNN